MSEVFWIAIVGFVSTLFGVFLGHWLQRRSTKQQREWELEERKRELMRKQKEPQFDIVRSWVKDTVVYLGHSGARLVNPDLYPPDELTGKLKEWATQALEVEATIYSRLGDEKLAKLCENFLDVARRLYHTIMIEKDESKIDELTDQMAKAAAEINQRIDKLWGETL